jgi:hypothetical protein
VAENFVLCPKSSQQRGHFEVISKTPGESEISMDAAHPVFICGESVSLFALTFIFLTI